MNLGWTGKGTLGGAGGIVAVGGTGEIVILKDGGATVRTAGSRGMPMWSVDFAMAHLNILSRSTMAC